ncbi:MAG: DUF1820 family protein [Gammaproteobacteria bacterium]
MASKTLFKVSFINQGKIYEIFARQIAQSSMYGFVEVEELVFGEKTSLVVDPSEERLKDEFAGVKRTYIPMHSVIRIDEVEKRGAAKILSLEGEPASLGTLSPTYLAGAGKPKNTP